MRCERMSTVSGGLNGMFTPGISDILRSMQVVDLRVGFSLIDLI